jgi:cyanophycin synthetase
MLERATRDPCFDLFLHAAKKLGVDVHFLVDEKTPLARFSHGGKRVLICENCTDLNDGAVTRVLKNKFVTSRILAKHDFPVPRSVVIPGRARRTEIERLVADLARPLVVKPVKGSGGKGIKVDISTPRELRAAVRSARRKQSKILVEEYIRGEDFRVVVMDGEVLDVVQRHPAFVLGDGESSIGDLIEQKNERRREVGIDHRIVVDASLRCELRSQDLRLRTKPMHGEHIRLQRICNFALGGENERIPLSEVHPDNIALFQRCGEPFGLRIVGPDFITPDIRRSHREVGGAFNEFNSAPMLSYVLGLEYDTLSSIEVLRRCLEL